MSLAVSESKVLSAPLGLQSHPFAERRDDAFFFPSESHLKALAFFGEVLWTRTRVGVITTEPGCGKTVLMQRFIDSLDERLIAAAVCSEHHNPQDFLQEILQQFGFALGSGDRTNRRRLLERFLHHQATMGRLCVLMVENLHRMYPAVLEELRLLAAIDVEGKRPLKLLLLGPTALLRVLASPRMSEVIRADEIKYTQLAPLSLDETARYIAHRLRAAGAVDPHAIIPGALITAIHAATRGVPRSVDRLCGEALASAEMNAVQSVTEAALEQAILALKLTAPEMPAFATEELRVAAKLVVGIQGQEDVDYELNAGRVLIGRGDLADVRINSVFVSRYHALIIRDHDRDLLMDLGSTNGVLVNAQRVTRHILKHRDLIQIGPVRVTYMNVLAASAAETDPSATVCFARPGSVSLDPGETASVLAFGR